MGLSMTPMELLSAHLVDGQYVLTPEQYQAFCEAVLLLPSEEQPLWDEAILSFVHEGVPIVLLGTPSAAQQPQE